MKLDLQRLLLPLLLTLLASPAQAKLNVVASLSDTITVLTRGQVLCEGDYKTVSANKDVQQAYMGVGHD